MRLIFRIIFGIVFVLCGQPCVMQAKSEEKEYQKHYKLQNFTALVCDFPCKLTIKPISRGKQSSLTLEGAARDRDMLDKLKVKLEDGRLMLSFIGEGQSYSTRCNLGTKLTGVRMPFFSRNNATFCFKVMFENGDQIVLHEKPTLVLCIPVLPQAFQFSRGVDASIQAGFVQPNKVVRQLDISLRHNSKMHIEEGFQAQQSRIELQHQASLTAAILKADRVTFIARHNSKAIIGSVSTGNMELHMLHSAKLSIKIFHGDDLRGTLSHYAKLTIKGGKTKAKALTTRKHAQLDVDGLEVEKIA